MKKIILILATAIMFASCAKTDPFEDIFNGNNKDVISPITNLDQEFENLNAKYRVLSKILKEHGVISENNSEIANKYDTALVFNQYLDCLSELPEVDFDKYTLIVGQFWEPNQGYYITDQRVVVDRSKIVMYIKRNEGEFVGNYSSQNFFAALYPNLPDLPVELINTSYNK